MKRWSRVVAVAVSGLLGVATSARADTLPRDEPVIEGVVRSASGQPVAGADVVVSRPDGTARRVAITDARGTFTLVVGHLGPARLLVVGPRGTRSVSAPFTLEHARSLALTITDDDAPDRLRVESLLGGPGDDRPLVGAEALRALRQRTLEYALVGLPGTAPPTPATGGVTVAGLGAAEIPVYFDGFRLNDPLTGAIPLALSPVMYGGAFVTDLAAPRLSLQAPTYAGESTTLNLGGGLVTAARGANGNDRPSGATSTGTLEVAADRRGFGGRVRGTVRAVANVEPWTADPGSATAPRGHRVSSVPVLAQGELALAGWQMRGTALVLISNTDFGRSDRVVAAGQPVKLHTEAGLYGVTARRQLRPGASDLSLAVGLVHSLRQLTPTVVDRVEDEGLRGSVASTLGLGGSLAGQHRLSLTAAFDWETGERRGRMPGREAALPPSHAEVSGLHPSLIVAERYRPAPWLLLEGTLEVAHASYQATARGDASGDTSRSYGLDLLWAPQAGLTLGPVGKLPTGVYSLQARAGRTGTRLPLAAVLGAPEEPRGELRHPAEDTVALGGQFHTILGTHIFQAALWAHARRLGGVVEDRFNPSTGRLQLVSPSDARRDYRALSASALLASEPVWFVIAGILQRLEGNYAGFTDPATGQLRPAGTGAFDGPDVLANRDGPLPADRPYGLRATVNAHWDWPQTSLHATLRGRLDAGTPLSATGRSVTSGEGQVYLLPSGSVGRTRAVASLDAGVGVRRVLSGRAAVTLALEGFNLTQRRSVVARDARLTDAVLGQTPTSLPTFQQAVAYAEPLLLRLMLGLEL